MINGGLSDMEKIVKKKCLVMLYKECALYEIVTSLELLNDICEIDVATPCKGEIISGMGLKVLGDISYDEALTSDYHCIIIPGGNIFNILENQTAIKIIRKSYERNSVIGAICSGPMILAKAGILKGRNFTHATYYPESQKQIWDGANFIRERHVVDGNIITAHPYGTISFSIAIAKELGYFEGGLNEHLCKATFNEQFEINWDIIKPIPDEEWEKTRESME